MNTAASLDEKVMAALAHGPVVPVILWASQRKNGTTFRYPILGTRVAQFLTD